MEKRKGRPRGKTNTVKGGYEKLAFGSINDAVRLMFRDGLTPEEMKKLDLFGISELRQTKEGLEIHFYDRLRAMQCLEALAADAEGKSPLYRALMESVAKTEGGTQDGI